MSIDLEYAIKADIRNNPVIREADRRERREFQRIMLLACLAVVRYRPQAKRKEVEKR